MQAVSTDKVGHQEQAQVAGALALEAAAAAVFVTKWEFVCHVVRSACSAKATLWVAAVVLTDLKEQVVLVFQASGATVVRREMVVDV